MNDGDGVQQYGIIKFAFCLLLTINVVSAINYCSLCSNHVACKNQTSVRFSKNKQKKYGKKKFPTVEKVEYNR